MWGRLEKKFTQKSERNCGCPRDSFEIYDDEVKSWKSSHFFCWITIISLWELEIKIFSLQNIKSDRWLVIILLSKESIFRFQIPKCGHRFVASMTFIKWWVFIYDLVYIDGYSISKKRPLVLFKSYLAS